jgi:hypothetical protein
MPQSRHYKTCTSASILAIDGLNWESRVLHKVSPLEQLFLDMFVCLWYSSFWEHISMPLVHSSLVFFYSLVWFSALGIIQWQRTRWTPWALRTWMMRVAEIVMKQLTWEPYDHQLTSFLKIKSDSICCNYDYQLAWRIRGSLLDSLNIWKQNQAQGVGFRIKNIEILNRRSW